MTISTPDIVRVIEARLTDCRCFGALVDPKGFKPCGGCEHDKHCLDEIVRLRAERDEARREVLNASDHIDQLLLDELWSRRTDANRAFLAAYRSKPR